MDYMEKIATYRKARTKKVIKKGTLAVGIVETTPVIWNGRLLRLEWDRNFPEGDHHFDCSKGFFYFVDFETGERTAPFATGHSFGSAYVENGVMYAVGTRGWGGETISLFRSTDLVNWEENEILTLPEGLKCYNTSLTKGDSGYVLAIEIDGTPEIVGESYTVIFAESEDLRSFTLKDPIRYVYTKDHYSACPVIRYVGGYYYMVVLEPLPYYKFVPFLVRSRDLAEWEPAPVNPIFFYDDDDRILSGDFTDEEKKLIATALDTNNSDVDLVEYNGKTVITYSWGNQAGTEFLAWAEFPGTVQEFFESFY